MLICLSHLSLLMVICLIFLLTVICLSHFIFVPTSVSIEPLYNPPYFQLETKECALTRMMTKYQLKL